MQSRKLECNQYAIANHAFQSSELHLSELEEQAKVGLHLKKKMKWNQGEDELSPEIVKLQKKLVQCKLCTQQSELWQKLGQIVGPAASTNASNRDKMEIVALQNLLVEVNGDKMEVGLWGEVASDALKCIKLWQDGSSILSCIWCSELQWIAVNCSEL